MRRGWRGRFSVGRQPYYCLALRDGDEMLLTRDCFESGKALAVNSQQLVVRNLFLLQFAKYVVIVGRLHPTLCSDLVGQRSHLIARGRVNKQRAFDELMW